MLANDEIDALLSPRIPSSFYQADPSDKTQGPVRRLFPRYKEVEQAYFRRTGIFPIMHVIVLRKDILEAYPWAARSLYKAFSQAKESLFQQIQDTSVLRLSLPWLLSELEETTQLMGSDYWPYGIAANRATLEAAISYSYEQGLTPRQPTLEELFVASTFNEFKI